MDSLVIIVLLLIIIAQGVERFFHSKQDTEDRREQTLAFLSKNSTELAVAIKTGKGKPEEVKEPDDVELPEATEKEFNNFIEQQNK